MPLPIITDVCRVTVNQSMGGRFMCNVLHVWKAGATNLAQDAAADVGAAWIAAGSIKSKQSGDLSLDSITALPLDGSAAGVTVIPGGWPTTGSQGTAAEACQVARIVTLKTGFGGRSRRGRMYIAGITISEVETDSTQWTVASTAAFQTAMLNFAGALDPGPQGTNLVVASYTNADFELVTSVEARRYFGTQRRRAN